MPPARPIRTILAASALVAALLVHPAPASAAPVAPLSVDDAPALVDRLGPDSTAGFYLESGTERVIVNVTTDAAEQEVLAAGGLAKRVTYSMAHLQSIRSRLRATPPIPGTTVGVYEITNEVIVEADSTVSEAKVAGLAAIAGEYGGAMRVERIAGALTLHIGGGNYIVGNTNIPGYRPSCSLGFNVRSKSDNDSLYFLTAGHCTGHPDYSFISDEWYTASGTYIGYRVGGAINQTNGFDFGLVRHYNANLDKPGVVLRHDTGAQIDITHSRGPGLGEWVCNSGHKSGYRCGNVIGMGLDVTYGNGWVLKDVS
ncbi:S1 family peptidase [Micromonospora deserti]|uniref:Peptidase S1A alpha-lytic prodomain domain-containing protein n=1 Tax=Micromonospora deserti TaxID=2070366 RepID=A0A2W2CP49_9ACTN|nr:S1 family peptidase [Micromonospora deserti]PZF99690.1 hypothetical protein C1I99_10865 [Micromonospora deserti]